LDSPWEPACPPPADVRTIERVGPTHTPSVGARPAGRNGPEVLLPPIAPARIGA
jgi:hypothetical protein